LKQLNDGTEVPPVEDKNDTTNQAACIGGNIRCSYPDGCQRAAA
jgi:hypothetical protein